MAGDINAFALGLELTLQDQASEVLRNVANLVDTVENKINKLQQSLSSFSGSMVNTGADITNSFKQTQKSMIDVSTQVNSTISDGVKLNDEMAQAQQANAEGIKKEAIAAQLEQSILKVTHKEVYKHQQLVKKFQDAALKFSKQNMKDYKGEILDKKTIQKLTKEQLKDYQEIQDLRQKVVKSAQAEEKRAAEGHKGDETWSKKVEGVLGKIGDLGRTIKGVFTGLLSGIGLGEIAQATTLTGLFDTSIMGLMKREEQYHTINFRAIGTQEELAKTVNKLVLSKEEMLRVTQQELDASTIALRATGAQKDEIDALRITTAELNRVTGADVNVTAKMAKQLSAATGNVNKSNQAIVLAKRYTKDFGLSAGDVNQVLGEVGKSAYYMGTSGSAQTEAYTKALFSAAAAAKRLGKDVGETVGVVEKMKNPLNTVAVLGPESLNWDVKKRQEEMVKWAATQTQALKQADAEGGQAGFRMRMRLSAYLEDLGVAYEGVDDFLRVQKEMGDQKPIEAQIAEVPKDATGLRKEMDEATLETQTGVRNINLAVSQMSAKLQETLRPLTKQFEQLLKLFLSDPIYSTIASWGVIALAVGGVLFGLFATVITGLVTMVSAVFSVGAAFVSMGVSAFNVLTSLISMGGGATSSLILLGKAGLVGATAFAGWKLGRLIDEVTGFGDSVDRVNKGTGTWFDYVKTYSNPIGIICTGYKKMLDASNAYADAKEREIRMNREEAKSHWVLEKFALQKAFREATKRGDRERALEISKQMDDINQREQDEYQASTQAKAIAEANKLKATEDAAKKAAEVRIQEEARVAMKTGENAEDLQKKLADAKTTVEAPTAAEVAGGAKPPVMADMFEDLKATAGPMLEKLGPMLAEMFKSLKDTAGPMLDKIGPMLAEMFKSLKDSVGPMFEKLGPALAMQEPKLENIAQPIAPPVGAAIETEAVKEPAKADMIATVKLPSPERRDEEEQNRILVTEVRRSADVLEKISAKITEVMHESGGAAEIVAILKTYLPQLSENVGTSGLASTANQWQG